MNERICRYLRPLCRLPGLRRSLAAQLAAAASLLLALPLILVVVLVDPSVTGATGRLALLAGTAAAGLGAFIAVAACLLAPIGHLTAMVRAYRLGGRLLPPRSVHYDEIGTLAGETVQTLREANAHLVRRARIDSATGALNREGLFLELEYLLQEMRAGECVVLALVEVRELGRWELALGPELLDAVRRGVTGRMREVAPARGAVGALGPHCFAFVAAGTGDAVERRLDELWDRLRAPLACDERALSPTFVMTIARGQGDESAVGLFHAAETALSSARTRAGDVRFESTETSAHLRDVATLGLALEEAIDRGTIEAAFQPRVDASTGAWNGAEALARWSHPGRGRISPGTFIPLAASSGRLVDLGRIMLDRAVAAVAAWQRAGSAMGVSVNVDADQLLAGTLEQDVVAALERHAVAPGRIELEITETSLLVDLEGARAQIGALRGRGVRVALDDFGTGYSSLGYLGRLPVDRLKIDRSFVAELETAGGQRVIRAMIDLARSLSLGITAEGVETSRQATRLREFGCDELQGFLYGHAQPVEAIARRPGAEAAAGRV